MSEVYYQTLSLFTMILLGCLLRRVGVLCREDAAVISRIMVNVTLPCVIIRNLDGVVLDREIMAAVLIGLGVNFFFFIQSIIFSKASDPDDRVVKIFSLTSFNVGSYAIPILTPFVTAHTMAGVLAFNYTGTILFIFGVAPTVAKMAYGRDGKGTVKLLKENLLQSVPAIACAVMLILAMLRVSLPAPVSGIVTSISGANTILAMLGIGVLLEFKLPKADLARDLSVLFLRLGTAVVCALGTYFLFPVSDDLKRALILVAFTPVSSCNPVLALHCGYGGSRVAVINSMLLLASVAIMSFLPALLY